jgi:hypothetical protein
MTEPILKRRSPYPWWLGVLIALDQLGNALGGGDPDETISSRIGRTKLKFGGRIPFWRRPGHSLIDKMLEKIDPGHSVDAIEKR